MIRASQTLNLLKFCSGGYLPIAGPLKASWSVTNLCNSRCKSCERWKRPKDKNELTTQEGCLLLKQLAQNKVADISFSGGEPLLRPDIFELVAFAKQQGLRVTLDTNGSLVNSSVAQKVCSMGIDRIYLSLDGAFPEVHDELRGVPGSYEKVMDAISFLQRQRNGLKPRIYVNTTLSKKNMGEFSQIVKLAYSKKLDGMTFQLAHDIARNNLHPSEDIVLNVEDVKRLQKEINLVQNKYSEFLLDNHEYYRNFEVFFTNSDQLYKYRCIAGYVRCVIQSNGDVISCDAAGYRLGSVRNNSFSDVWYSEKANRIRKIIKENDHPMCWQNCIAPINIRLDNVNLLKIHRLFQGRAFSKIFHL